MKKITKCPKCGWDNPPLYLKLRNPENYENDKKPPETRTYDVICFECGSVVEASTIDNTIKGIKSVRDEMETLYGQPQILYGR
ncbi:MAG: hypothetical protein PHG51_06335 [Candidatus Omnitrophica bacterium]|nr:hypothetical protein [Candidatus Omnitrophota bacterium]